MKKRISEFISQLLIASSLLLISAPATGQTPSPTKVKKEEKKETPLYQGTAVGLEIAGLASHLLGSDILSSEIQIQSNLKNRFLPVLEIGYGKLMQSMTERICITRPQLLSSGSEWITISCTKKLICRDICM